MTTDDATIRTFNKDLHIAYFAFSLKELPKPYAKLDTNRLTLVHFAVQALDMLGLWDDPDRMAAMHLSKQKIIEWVYSLHLVSTSSTGPTVPPDQVGFLGGTFLGDNVAKMEYQQGHIAMTYTALATLRTLGDDLSRIDRQGIVIALKKLQLSDGSFTCVSGQNAEHDLRFLYCACCICFFLDDWSGINTDLAVEYIKSCRSFDGAIGLIPGQEGHGGSTFCGTAALVLMGKLDQVLDEDDNSSMMGITWRKELISWCIHRQVGGMQGRPGKDEDTCYSYWIGGTLRLLQQDHLLRHEPLRNFIMKCQSPVFGGFGKLIGNFPDMLHSFYSMAWLSLSNVHFDDNNQLPIHPLNCTLGIRQDKANQFGGQHLP